MPLLLPQPQSMIAVATTGRNARTASLSQAHGTACGEHRQAAGAIAQARYLTTATINEIAAITSAQSAIQFAHFASLTARRASAICSSLAAASLCSTQPCARSLNGRKYTPD